MIKPLRRSMSKTPFLIFPNELMMGHLRFDDTQKQPRSDQVVMLVRDGGYTVCTCQCLYRHTRNYILRTKECSEGAKSATLSVNLSVAEVVKLPYLDLSKCEPSSRSSIRCLTLNGLGCTLLLDIFKQ